MVRSSPTPAGSPPALVPGCRSPPERGCPRRAEWRTTYCGSSGRPCSRCPSSSSSTLVLLGRGGVARFGAGLAAAAVAAVVVVAGLPPAQSNAVPVSQQAAARRRPRPGCRDDRARADDSRSPSSSTRPWTRPRSPRRSASSRTPPSPSRGTTRAACSRSHRVSQWQPDTLYVADRVAGNARAANGGPLRSRRALRRADGAGRLRRASPPPARAASAAASTTAFRITAGPARRARGRHGRDPAHSPTVAGDVTAGDAAGEFVFTPDAPLAVDTTYTVSLAGLVDADGVAFGDAARPVGPDLGGARGRALPPARRRRGRRAHGRDLGPVHRAHGPRPDRRGLPRDGRTAKRQGRRRLGRAGPRARLRPGGSAPVRREGRGARSTTRPCRRPARRSRRPRRARSRSSPSPSPSPSRPAAPAPRRQEAASQQADPQVRRRRRRLRQLGGRGVATTSGS